MRAQPGLPFGLRGRDASLTWDARQRARRVAVETWTGWRPRLGWIDGGGGDDGGGCGGGH